jgi:hypothetical protein
MQDERFDRIKAAYAEIEEAFRNKALDTLAKYIAPGWTGVAGEHTVTRDELLDNVRGQFETLDDISWPRTITLVSAGPDRIVVNAAGTYRAIQRENGEPFELYLANEDTWTHGPNGWQNSGSRSLE